MVNAFNHGDHVQTPSKEETGERFVLLSETHSLLSFSRLSFFFFFFSSLSDAEIAENNVQQLLHVDRPRDAPEFGARHPQLLGGEVERQARLLGRP